jgi:hypothetical protein
MRPGIDTLQPSSDARNLQTVLLGLVGEPSPSYSPDKSMSD